MSVNGSTAETIAVLASKVGTANSTPLLTSYVSAKNCGQIFLEVALGDMAAETVDVAIYQATSSGGGSAKSAKAITQLAASAGANDNAVVKIAMRADELDVDGGFSFVAGRVVTGGATGGTVGIILHGDDLRFGPASKVEPSGAVLQTVP